MPPLPTGARARLWALVPLTLIAALMLAGCSPGPAGGPGPPPPIGGTEPIPGSPDTVGPAPGAATTVPVAVPVTLAPSPLPAAPTLLPPAETLPPPATSVLPTVVAPLPSATSLPATPAPVPTKPAPPKPLPPSPTPAPPTVTPQPAAYSTNRLASLQIALEPLAPDFDQPVYVTHAADGSGRLFVSGKAGEIWIVKDGQALAAPFLDISDRVGSGGSEQGLLGLAFPPDFGQRRYFFVNYTDKRGDTVVARFSLAQDPDRADAASEFRILWLDQPAANHNGGMLAFGRDGYLYAGIGDGGGAGDTFHNGQNPGSLFAKILRLDVTSDPTQPYLVPADNPWVGKDWNGQTMRPEAWQIGLRNPWRFAFDRQTGDLWIADVGQNQYEEVNRVPGNQGGLNFGWPIMEGKHCYPSGSSCASGALVLPVVEYTHAEGGCSITGGYIYRGSQFPALNGIYLYGDYCSGKVWGVADDGQGGRISRLLLSTDLGLSSFGEDEAGEVYLTDLSGGKVYHVVAR